MPFTQLAEARASLCKYRHATYAFVVLQVRKSAPPSNVFAFIQGSKPTGANSC